MLFKHYLFSLLLLIFYDYFKFLKFGFSRATDQASLHVRRGRLTRNEAVKIVRERDGKFPYFYLGKSIEDILKPLDLTVDEFEKIDQLIVYPNPASDVLFLSTDNTMKFERVQVYNLNGALVKTFSNTSQVNISDLASGQYLLMVDHKGKLEYTKFVKQ